MFYLKYALIFMQKFGFNVLPLRNKRPILEWNNWQEIKQSEDDIKNMEWNNATGLGAVMGIDDLRLFDLDGVEDIQIVDMILEELGLPDNYPWVVQSGSGVGFHIYFRSKYDMEIFEKMGGEKAVYKFKLKQDGVCKHIELRWKECQTALPPSMHESGGMYNFYFNEPIEKPTEIEVELVIKCLEKFCLLDKPIIKVNVKEEHYFDQEKLESAIDWLSEKLPKGSYEEWYRIGFALVPLGEMGEKYFIEMSLQNPNYDDSEAELKSKFAELVRDYDGRIGLGSIYHIAETYGWKKPIIKFWYLDEKKQTKISRIPFKKFLESEGFCKYKIESNRLFIKIDDNVVEEIDTVDVKDFVMGYIYTIPSEELEGTNKSEIADALIKGANQFFTVQFLEFLIIKNVQFNRDTRDKGFIYFDNGYVEVTKFGITLKDYKTLENNIWKKQIIRRNYATTSKRTDFEEFIHNICRRDVKRTAALKSAIGYLLHLYKDPSNAKAVIFIDEKLSEGSYGRSGKGLVIKGIGQLRNVVIEDGRNFNPSKNFAFQRVKADTNIIALEDIKDKFPFERLFSIITDGITIERKNKDEIFIPFIDSPKVVVSTNFTISGVDDSSMDRQFIIEFSDHYNKTHKPIHDYGKLFFESWDEAEWKEFFCFMIECLRDYLENGLVDYDRVNIDKKKLIDETCEEFAEFSERLELNTEYEKKDLYEDFIKEYEDYDPKKAGKLTQGKFTRWLKVWARIKEYEVSEVKSGSKRSIQFVNPMEKRAA